MPSYSTPSQAGEGTHSPFLTYSHSAHINSIFYLLIGLNAATTLAWFLFYKPPTFAEKHQNSRIASFVKEFDYIGTLLFIMGLLLFLMGLSWGGTLHPWTSANVIAYVTTYPIQSASRLYHDSIEKAPMHHVLNQLLLSSTDFSPQPLVPSSSASPA
jgi:hypothetical protein